MERLRQATCDGCLAARCRATDYRCDHQRRGRWGYTVETWRDGHGRIVAQERTRADGQATYWVGA